MFRKVAVLLIWILAFGVASAFAQETPGPGRVELSIIPGGGLFFTKADSAGEPSFDSYDLGGALTVNFGRFGVEAEVLGNIGLEQALDFGTSSLPDTRTPNMLGYNANVIVPLTATRSSLVPYATAGVGGLTLFDKPEVGLLDSQTFLTGNVGGGLKWYAGRWGLRADYRFIAVRSKDDASSFFGKDDRYAHRVYGGVILNILQ